VSEAMFIAVMDNAHEPIATKTKVPNPTGLCDFCLAIPKINDNTNVTKNLNNVTSTLTIIFLNPKSLNLKNLYINL